jgi:hypothetical protein
VQISDGAVQTSAVDITVRKQGGAEATGANAAVFGASGIVYYTPSQAETDTTSFEVIASKTGCIPVAVTVVTTASAVAGYAGLDWSLVRAPTTTLALTGTTIATSQVVASVSGAVGSVTGLTAANLDVAVSTRMATYTQPTGFLAATFPGGTIANTTNITAGTIATVTTLTNLPSIPANWLTAAGIAAGALNGKGDWSTTTPPTAATIATQVWSEAIPGSYTGGQAGGKLNSAGSAGDPWSTALPGAYGAGTAGKIVGDNINAPVGSVPTATQNADALLNRDMSAVSDTNARSPLNALRFLRNKWSISGTALTVTKENDSTAAWTAVVTAAPGADPISGNDPA